MTAGRARTPSITPAGWGLIGITSVSYVLGVVLAWREALVVAAGGLVLLVVSVVWLFGRLGVEVQRMPMPTHVEVGSRLVAELTFHNPTWRTIGGRVAEDRVGDTVVPLRVPAIHGRSRHDERYVIPTDSRGAFTVGPIRVVRADPFGFFRRERVVGEPVPLFITPRVHALEPSGRSWRHDIEGPTFDMSPQGTVFHTLREYVRGDDHRHIHWRSSARTGTLMVRQYVDTRWPSTLVVFDNRVAEYQTDDDFELAVEIVASVAMGAVGAGRPLALFALDADLGGVAAGQLGEQVLERLCLLAPSGAHDVEALMRVVGLAGVEATETVLVTGRAGEGFLPALRTVPGGEPIVVRVQRGEQPLPVPRGHVIDVTDAREFVVQWNAVVRR